MNLSIDNNTDLRYTKASKTVGMKAWAEKNAAQHNSQQKFKSSYETVFSDVVTPCYVRGYNWLLFNISLIHAQYFTVDSGCVSLIIYSFVP